jgi:tellurite resistance protein TerC
MNTYATTAVLQLLATAPPETGLVAEKAATSVPAATESLLSGHFPPVTVAIFVAIFVCSLIVDLVQHREHKDVTVANAALWSVFWVSLSLGFCGWLKYYHAEDHPDWPSLFLTGYVLEKTLSVDNLMVFIAIFRYFNIRSGLQHRILYFGILGAIVFRAIFVGLGSGLMAIAGPFAEVIFGAFVIWAAVQMVRGGDDDGDGEPDYESMPLVRWAKKIYPVFPRLVEARFFVDRATVEPLAARDPSLKLGDGIGKWMTPALVCLLVIEGSDVMFSFDSVPAVVSVTKEPLIVFTAMIFAVLGLRSLYFIVEALVRYLSQLEKAVIFVLFFIGAKMFVGAAAHWGLKLPWWGYLTTAEQANWSLVVVLGVLALGVASSFVWPAEDEAAGTPPA